MTTTSAPTPATPSRTRRIVAISLAIIVALVVAFFIFANLYADWLWYQQLGFTEVLATQLIARLAMFVIGFLGISVLATIGAFSRAESTDLANLSRWAFLFSFAGIGLRTNLRVLSNQGWRPLVVGIVGECAIAALTLALVLGAARWLA